MIFTPPEPDLDYRQGPDSKASSLLGPRQQRVAVGHRDHTSEFNEALLSDGNTIHGHHTMLP